MRKRLLWLFILGFLPGLGWTVDGMLSPVQGTVYIQRPAANLWEEVIKPVAVEEGTGIRTGNGSYALLITPDAHRVAIGPDTQIKLQRFAQGETKLFLKGGSIRNKVRKLQLDLGQYYKIQTPTAVVAVRGTDFAGIQAQTAQDHLYERVVDLNALKKENAQTLTPLKARQSAKVEA